MKEQKRIEDSESQHLPSKGVEVVDAKVVPDLDSINKSAPENTVKTRVDGNDEVEALKQAAEGHLDGGAQEESKDYTDGEERKSEGKPAALSMRQIREDTTPFGKMRLDLLDFA